ncbi:MAG TPA: bifunctional (p)ppGpp synthetase/guanosine-3',5'-bis(diphosphate) 3'-pyrophosphohydrolase [Gammaproteobacteria bacterium]|nr:bifunctional (p)ppGpp synthetase/guanosine-3',5'-bis(diphosphate) 3'-pyrophosphohydrolase [Gammaproteobacteria bacterium]
MVTLKKKSYYAADGTIDPGLWLEKTGAGSHLKNRELICRAIQIADTTCKGLTTFYGQPCIEQSLDMADILLDMRLDDDSIAAAIMTGTLQHTTLSLDAIENALGTPVAKLVGNILKLNTLNQLHGSGSRDKTQLDRLRKIFLAMVSDIRVVLIKLAERTCLMRGIKQINPVERKRIAEETMDIYAPLANRLGIGQLKWELEDAAFHYTHPETYKTIATFLAERRVDREERIHQTIQKLEEALTNAHIKATINGRAKHIYSIYRKASRKQFDYAGIYDYSAVRILVPTLEDCYTALSLVHALFEHIPDEFDDYISHPKPNGYRSIHTAVIGSDGKHLEIQIRTNDMHDEAEHGVAAHWIYKEDKTLQSGYETKITFLRQLLAWHKDVQKQETTPGEPLHDSLDDTVYVFTPAGDIIDLPKGATPLDFAYHIHSAVGHRCRGAKIKGHIVPLTYKLNTGDQVEIITTPTGTPSRDWLRRDAGYLYTSRARAKVAHWFKQQDLQQTARTEKENNEREISRSRTDQEETPFPPLRPGVKPPDKMDIAGIHDLLTRIAKCCKPVPGDDVIGYITLGRGVSIHRRDCQTMAAHFSRDTSRLIEVAWDSQKSGSYYVDLHIQADGQRELLKEITSLLANAKIDLITLNSTISKKNNTIYLVMTIQIHDLAELKSIIQQIGQLPKVMDVRRMNT